MARISFHGTTNGAGELKVSPTGTMVYRLSVAENHSYMNRYSDRVEVGTTWHRVVAIGEFGAHFFDALTEKMEETGKKGVFVKISGTQETRDYVGADGAQRSTMEVKVFDPFGVIVWESDVPVEVSPQVDAPSPGRRVSPGGRPVKTVRSGSGV